MEWIGWIVCVFFANASGYEAYKSFTLKACNGKHKKTHRIIGCIDAVLSLVLWFAVFFNAPFEISIK